MFASGRTYTSPPAAGEQRIVRKPKYRAGSSIIDHRSPTESLSHPDVVLSGLAHSHRLYLVTIRRSSLLSRMFALSLLSHAFPASVFRRWQSLKTQRNDATMLLPAYRKRKNNTGRRQDQGGSADELRSVRRKISWSHILVKEGIIAVCQL